MTKRTGFTVIELVVVIMVGVALTSIAIRSMAGVQQRMAVRQARTVYAAMHARARAQAIEFGQNVEIDIDPGGDSIWVSRNDTTLDVIRLFDELGIDLQTAEAVTICMNSRGFADESCNSFEEDETVTLVFVMGDRSDSLRILPLGQVIY
jgi:type II secretory pathway pseudopilin PulG